MDRLLAVVLIVSMAVGCTEEVPCPPGARNLSAAEADDALVRAAARAEAEGRKDDDAVLMDCRWATSGGGFEARDKITLGFTWVVWCATQVKPLGECLTDAARGFVAKSRSINKSPEAVERIKKEIQCKEVWRNVDLSADKHGLQRQGPDEWVPAIIWLILQAADKAMVPVGGPAMFIIKPGSGVEEACADLPEEPAKKCADSSGCPDAPPDGAEPPDQGGVILPPITSGGGTSGGGDF